MTIRGPAARGLCGALLGLILGASASASAEAPRPPDTVCDLIGEAARRHELPLSYFTRLIWQESRFRSDAVSPAGAQGVAQFMPRTAAERLLADPFATREALFASAAYLAQLRDAFGNLGLAAAAYNAGPSRVSRWLAGNGALPTETIGYVLAVTGHDATEWITPAKALLSDDEGFSCEQFQARAGRVTHLVADASGAAETKDWAVILLGSPRREQALSEYRLVKTAHAAILGDLQPSVVYRRIAGMQIPRYIVEIEQDTRSGADALCARLAKRGGTCFVLRTAAGARRP